MKTAFEFFPEDNPNALVGVLLIHGLLDSTFIMHEIAKVFQQQGCFVKGILLPGHGTSPEDLQTVQYSQWIEAVQTSVTAMKNAGVQKILFAGYSLGAALSLLYALEGDPAVLGIIGISPCFRLYGSLPLLVNLCGLPQKIFRGLHWPQWLRKKEELDSFKYSSIAANAAIQVVKLNALLRKKLDVSFLPCPLFLALSYEDTIISSNAALHYFCRNTHPDSRAIVWSEKMISISAFRKIRKKYSDSRIIFRNSVFPESGIVNFSHIAIPVSPENSHYGKNGDYPLASRINPDKWQYGEVHTFHEKITKLKYRLGLSLQNYARLTFNPDFDFLVEEMIIFLRRSYKNLTIIR